MSAVDTAMGYASDYDDAQEAARNRRAERADADADERDIDAGLSASAAEERDRQAEVRDHAAAHRHVSLLLGAFPYQRDDRVDDVTGLEEPWAVRQQARIDDEVRRSVLAEAATLEFDELLGMLDQYCARWQAARRELEIMAGDRAAAARDRRNAAGDRETASRARTAAAADRARGAADRDQRQIEQAQLPRDPGDYLPGLQA